jgi:hypothetical protein
MDAQNFNCQGITNPEEIASYRNTRARYVSYSADNFRNTVANYPYNNIFNDPEEIDLICRCIRDYYGMYFNLPGFEAETLSLKEKVLSYLFYTSHNYDLVRCMGYCVFTIPVELTNPNYANESLIYRNMILNLMINTGNRIMANQFKDGNTKELVFNPATNRNDEVFHDIYPINYNIYYTNDFYQININPTLCMQNILSVVDDYIKLCISDIIENRRFFEDKHFNIRDIIRLDQLIQVVESPLHVLRTVMTAERYIERTSLPQV